MTMADNEVKEIIDDTESLLKKITHKICDILIGSSRKKMEKICSDPNVIIHMKDIQREIEKDVKGEKNE
jgi:hypothetical protein